MQSLLNKPCAWLPARFENCCHQSGKGDSADSERGRSVTAERTWGPGSYSCRAAAQSGKRWAKREGAVQAQAARGAARFASEKWAEAVGGTSQANISPELMRDAGS